MKNLIHFGCLMFILWFCVMPSFAQKKFSVEGSAGITYEHYGLNKNPADSNFFYARKPWNQVRFLFTPTFKFPNDLTIPFNINFATVPTAYAGPYAGLRTVSFGEWITNPLNNFGVNPKYKWAELQLGTQYLRYSDLSTGDIGIFGGGIDLRPKIFRFKYFRGISQQQINYVAGPIPPGVQGAYRRRHWMMQFGVEKESDYKVLINMVKGLDRYGILPSPPPTIQPQESFIVSMVLEKSFKEGWYIKTEGARSYFTKNKTTSATFDKSLSFDPFIFSRTSTQKDHAAEASLGKRSTSFDIGFTTKYLGAGFQTMGFPYMQPDHWDNTVNTRINAMKNNMNITASAGIRTNNISDVSLSSKQFIGNINWFTQFNEHFNLNLAYNNFGFSAASGLNPFGIRNVSNDVGISPGYSWTTTKVAHLLTSSYNYSKYDERDVLTGLTTANNTHTVLLSYIPTFLTSDVTTDYSVMYFKNTVDSLKNSLLTFSGSLGFPAAKKKMQLRSQVQYTIGKLNAYTPNNNLLLSLNVDYKLTKNLVGMLAITTNFFKYGNELAPPPSLLNASYLENTIRSGLKYNFKTAK